MVVLLPALLRVVFLLLRLLMVVVPLVICVNLVFVGDKTLGYEPAPCFVICVYAFFFPLWRL